MLILLAVEVIGILALYLMSRGKFKDELAFDDEKGDRLKTFLPIGLQLMAVFNHSYRSAYEKGLETRLAELKGVRYAHDYLKIHIAAKTVIMAFSLVFITFVGTQAEIDASYAVFSIILLAALFYVTDRQLDNRVRKRRREIQIEFPEFLNKLILMINAGLTVSGAMQKILRDNRKENSLYLELGIALNDINSGKPELQAYEEFAKRCRLQEVTMFVSILVQNLRKGNSELIPVLRLQANTCWENRKNIARKLGEEASTKLLFPMIIVFVAILIMIMTPAVFQLGI